MGSAIGGSIAPIPGPAGTNGTVDRGPFYVNLGPLMTPGGGSANGAIIEAQIVALSAQIAAAYGGGTHPLTKGTLFIPNAPNSGGWGIEKTIDVYTDQIEIIGEGDGSFLVLNPTLAIDMFRIGMTPSGTAGGVNVTMDSTYRPDLFGVLDATAAASAGHRWGFRSNLVAFMNFQSHPFTRGQQWTPYGGSPSAPDDFMHTTQLTYEFAFQINAGDGTPPNGWQIFGCGDAGHQLAFPVVCYGDHSVTGNELRFLIGTQSAPFATPSVVIFDCALASTGLHRITLQIDLVAGNATVWADGLQVNTRSMPTGGHFAENILYPFLLLDNGADRASWGNTSPLDATIYGFKMAAEVVYAVGSNGSVQTKIGGSTSISDAFRYFTATAMTLGYLQFIENPATLTRDLFTIGGATAAAGLKCSGYIAHRMQSDIPLAPTAQVSFSKLKLQGGTTYGQGIAIGLTLDTHINDCTIQNFANSVGQINGVANYNHRFSNLRLYATDNCVYGYLADIYFFDIQCQSNGRWSMKLIGCNSNLQTFNSAGGGPNGLGQGLFYYGFSLYGGTHSVRSYQTDDEGGNAYSRALIHCEPGDGTGRYDFRIPNIASLGNFPMFELQGSGGNLTSFFAEMPDLGGISNNTVGLITCNSSLFYGSTTGGLMGPSPRFTSSNNTPARITVEENIWTAPPRFAVPWVTGAHILNAPHPVQGQYGGWRCAAGASTADTSTWIGRDLMLTSPADLACYLQNPAGAPNILGNPAAATGYAVAFTPATTAVAGNAIVYLTGGSALAAPLVVTLADASGTFAGTVTIPVGKSFASTNYTPTGAGSHTVTATHTGGNTGMGDPTIGAVTVGASVTAATSYAAIVLPQTVSYTGNILFLLSGGTTLTAPLVITPADTAGGIGGAVTIPVGGFFISATDTPTSSGSHTITATHTGGNGGMTDPGGATVTVASNVLFAGIVNAGAEPTIGTSNYSRPTWNNTAANTTINVDGSRSVAVAVPFPTFSGAIPATTVSLFAAGTGGSALISGAIPGTAESGNARTFPSGSTPTFAAGALVSY